MLSGIEKKLRKCLHVILDPNVTDFVEKINAITSSMSFIPIINTVMNKASLDLILILMDSLSLEHIYLEDYGLFHGIILSTYNTNLLKYYKPFFSFNS